MKKVIIPLPDLDFDVTEVSVPWKLLTDHGFQVVFSTEQGNIAKADPLLITGVIFGQLGAKPLAIKYYREMEKSPAFLHPIKYEAINASEYDAIHLPGGHAPGMKPYLENKILQSKLLDFHHDHTKIIGAICHGVIVLARSIDPATGKPIIYNHKLTALIKFLEQTAYYLTAWKLGNYYRTYPEYVQDEVVRNIADPTNFVTGNPFKPLVVEDKNLITARWPLDAFHYANALIHKLQNTT